MAIGCANAVFIILLKLHIFLLVAKVSYMCHYMRLFLCQNLSIRGITNQCRARFLVSYSGNIQIPTGGTVGEISIALAVDGEPLQSTRMIVTPAAVENFFNVSAQAYIDVPRGCCSTVAVQNTSTQAIEVQNSNLIAVREA